TAGCEQTRNYQRIVSVGGSVTEIIYALGCGDLVVAADISSLYPHTVLEEKPNVGYMRTLSAEPILSLEPDLILADAESEPAAVLPQLQGARVQLVTVPVGHTVAGIYKKIRVITETLGNSAQGEKLIHDIEKIYLPVARQIESVPEAPRVVFLLTSGKGSPMA